MLGLIKVKCSEVLPGTGTGHLQWTSQPKFGPRKTTKGPETEIQHESFDEDDMFHDMFVH